MPEILEIEYYRRAGEAALRRPIKKVLMPDGDYLRGVDAAEMRKALKGSLFTTARRRGKLMMLDVDSGPVLGLRFGMTGRLEVDGAGPIEKLEYAPSRQNPEWDRFGVEFADGGTMVVSDPRRLGNVTLDPDLSKMGPDAWTGSVDELTAALGTSTTSLKSRLMDQARWAGLGNLLTDETLWRAGLDPHRGAGKLTKPKIAKLHKTMHAVLNELSERGGSHMGDLQEERSADGRCPKDGAELRREKVGGRTTYWCPKHQS